MTPLSQVCLATVGEEEEEELGATAGVSVASARGSKEKSFVNSITPDPQ